MANCSFVAVGARTHSSTITYPAGIQPGDLLLMCLFKKGISRSWSASQTGWTSRKTQRSNDNFGFGEVYSRICDGTEATFSLGGSPDCGYIIAWRPAAGFGFSTAAPDAISGAAGLVAPSLTPTQIDDLLIYMIGSDNSTSGTLPTGFTATRVNEFHNSFYHVYLADELDYASTSPTGTITGTGGGSPLCIDALFKIDPNETDAPFISSGTQVFALALVGDEAVPFIPSIASVFSGAVQSEPRP